MLCTFHINDIPVTGSCWEVKEMDTWIVPIVVPRTSPAQNDPVPLFSSPLGQGPKDITPHMPYAVCC